MATSRDLFLSILALDAYNRGYSPGMSGITETATGDAEVIATSENIVGSEQASFYAVAYDWNGETVISYRGTSFPGGPDLIDVGQGWTMSLGWSPASQPQLAKAFYTAVTGLPVYGTAAPTNVTLTGHSLGGGLAPETSDSCRF